MRQEEDPPWPTAAPVLTPLLHEAHAHQQAGRLEEAEALFNEILTTLRKPASPEEWHIRGEALHLLGGTFYARDKFGTAIDLIAEAIRINPTIPSYQTDLGAACFKLGLKDQALKHCKLAVLFDPNFAYGHYNLGHVYDRRGDAKEARAAYERALALKPDDPDTLVSVGTTHHAENDLDTALSYYERAVALAPNDSQAHYNIGVINHDKGLYRESIAHYERALALKPDYVMAHWNYGLAQLALGNFKTGWDEYEWRWQMHKTDTMQDISIPGRRFARPMWSGQIRTRVHIHMEQGLGDTVQFCRYAPMVAAMENDVTLEVQPALVDLLRFSFPTVKVIPVTPDWPGAYGLGDFDYHIPVMSLPRAFGTDEGTIPWRTPYLKADPERVARVRPSIEKHAGGRLKVGICWSSGIREGASLNIKRVGMRKSTTLETFAPLANPKRVALFSLQVGPPAAELVDSQFKVIDLMGDVKDFADTAAIMECLDLVITVDTAVGHVAGAIGRPVWILELADGCWRWLMGREDTPWYPTMRLFRQQRVNDWGHVVERVAVELTHLTQTS